MQCMGSGSCPTIWYVHWVVDDGMTSRSPSCSRQDLCRKSLSSQPAKDPCSFAFASCILIPRLPVPPCVHPYAGQPLPCPPGIMPSITGLSNPLCHLMWPKYFPFRDLMLFINQFSQIFTSF